MLSTRELSSDYFESRSVSGHQESARRHEDDYIINARGLSHLGIRADVDMKEHHQKQIEFHKGELAKVTKKYSEARTTFKSKTTTADEKTKAKDLMDQRKQVMDYHRDEIEDHQKHLDALNKR
jgi:hypothetical protein